jgi:NAD(P)-dependent dehydrogenase (short-subunit alcohol dehydrogenase family)
VVIADLRADAAAGRAAELGTAHAGFGCDVGAEAEVVALMRRVRERFGRIDVLVNNAGIGEQAVMTLEQTVEAFDRIVGVHLRGTFLASREAARVFVEQQSGAIVNLSSVAGLHGHPGRNAYGAAKAGISSMTEAMASEWARDGIRVNAVAPGVVATEMSSFTKTDGGREFTLGIQALKRLAQPDDIAGAIVFLASDAARWITGDTIHVDGGSKL